MELDDLKAVWQELDLQAERAKGLRLGLGRDRAHPHLRRTALLIWLELAVNALAALLAGNFLAAHLYALRFAVPALALLGAAAFLIAADVRQLALLGRMDPAGPVLEVQRLAAELRALRARTDRRILMAAPLLWTPLALVAARGLLHLDLYRAFGIPWVAGNLAFGLAFLLAALWAARRFRDRLARSGFLRSLADDLTGRSLGRALGHLEEAEKF